MRDRESASLVEAVAEDEALASKGRGPLAVAMRRLLRKKVAVAALAFIAVFYFCGVFAPWVAPHSFTDQNLDNVLQGPSLEHPFGTDRLGRDMLSRVIWASRTTVVVTVATLVTGGIVLAVGLGLLAGYVGGKVDTAVMRLGDVFFALPGLPMLIMINATLGDRVRGMGWLKTLEDTLQDRRLPRLRPYLRRPLPLLPGWEAPASSAPRCWPCGRRSTCRRRAPWAPPPRRIIVHHLLPNVSNIVIVSLSASLGAIASTEIALTWFGVGIQPPDPQLRRHAL